jgi:hypothetical protein
MDYEMTKQWWKNIFVPDNNSNNISLSLDLMYPELSKRERDILCVYRLFEAYDKMLEKGLDAESYIKLVEGYEDDMDKWIIKIMISVKPIEKYEGDLEKIIRWILFREKEEPMLQYYDELDELLDEEEYNFYTFAH